jgi:hypothetical protein
MTDPRHAPAEIPKDIFKRVSTLCLALPEVTVRVDQSRTRTRSTAHSFEIRRRSFCLLVATADPVTESYRTLAPKRLTALLD